MTTSMLTFHTRWSDRQRSLILAFAAGFTTQPAEPNHAALDQLLGVKQASTGLLLRVQQTANQSIQPCDLYVNLHSA